jgi:hypothetical protein
MTSAVKRDRGRDELEQPVERRAQTVQALPLLEAEDGAQDDLEGDGLHARSEREALAGGPRRDLPLGHHLHERAVALHPLPVERREQQPPLAQVLRPVEQEHGARPQQRREDLVALTRQELVRIPGEDLPDRVGMREDDPRAPSCGSRMVKTSPCLAAWPRRNGTGRANQARAWAGTGMRTGLGRPATALMRPNLLARVGDRHGHLRRRRRPNPPGRDTGRGRGVPRRGRPRRGGRPTALEPMLGAIDTMAEHIAVLRSAVSGPPAAG